MKKLFTLLLAVGFVFGMVACGGESSSTEEANTTEEAAPAAEEVEAVEEEAPMEEAAADSTAMEAEEAEPEATEE